MKKRSLGSKLILLFCTTSILPILVLGVFSYYSSVNTIRENTRVLSSTNLKQIDDNLNILLESYEDLLYQIYTDDDMVKWTDNLNEGKDESVTVNQMRRFIRGILNSKDYIRSITILTEDGTAVTYDQLTAQTYQNSWMNQYPLGQDQLYEEVIEDYHIHIFPTEYATTFANQDYYLFHLAHRIVDYRNLEKKNGIVILSLDVSMLQQVCRGSDENGGDVNFNFIADSSGKLISYEEPSLIGTQAADFKAAGREAGEKYSAFLKADRNYDNQYTMLSVYSDEKLGWDIVGVTDQSRSMQMIKRQLLIILLLSLGLFAIAISMMFGISSKLVNSVRSIVRTMKKTQDGNMSERVEVKKEMPAEIEEIAVAFNHMLEKLDAAKEKERQAVALQQDAQIKALEAQINPHFLYNTLDTINWMAIDHDAFDISNAINSLAKILRYAISDSNRETTVAQEIDWLKKYIYLQQFRLKEQFECDIQVQPDVQQCRIHKLLLQPFVENAILHGFQDGKPKHLLQVTVEKEQEDLKIKIKDNGTGIPQEVLQKFRSHEWEHTEGRNHIGMQNALVRLEMYYGKNAAVSIDSEVGAGTEVSICIPYRVSENQV